MDVAPGHPSPDHCLVSGCPARGGNLTAPSRSAPHYPRDIAFVIDDVLFAARLNSAHRLPEADALTDPTTPIPEPALLAAGTIEGGDVMLHDGCVLVGLSEETSPDGANALQA